MRNSAYNLTEGISTLDRLPRSTRQLSERPLPLTRLRAIIKYGLGIGIIPKPDDPSSLRSANPLVALRLTPRCHVIACDTLQGSVIANPGRFSRDVAISSLLRTLSGMGYVPESEQIATTKKLSRDDTGLVSW